jgi:SAM-dependent methyltransferase
MALRSPFDLNGKRALEVGAGTGAASSSVAARGAEVVALDSSAESVTLIQRTWGHQFPNLTPLRAEALALPFADSSFDLVFHDGVLEHFPDPDPFLRENWRVIKPGGILVAGVPQKFNPYTVYKQALIFLNRWPYGWETQYSVGELAGLLRRNRFQVGQIFTDGVIGTFGPRSVRLAQKVADLWGLQRPSNGSELEDPASQTSAGEELIFRLSRYKIIRHFAFSVVMTATKFDG